MIYGEFEWFDLGIAAVSATELHKIFKQALTSNQSVTIL